MPRTGPRRSLTTAAALLAMLAAPAAAQAATYTVNPGAGACGAPADTDCGGLGEAAIAAAPGDVFNVSPGPAGNTYGSATFSDAGVTIAATAPGVVVNGALVFSAPSGGASNLQGILVSSQSGSGPAVSVTGAAGLQIIDSIILSKDGDGVQFHEGTTNKIVRSSIASTNGQATAAVRVLSADASTSAKALTMESTLAVGKLAGVSVNTGDDGVASSSGAVTLSLRHVTAVGTNGLVLDSTKAAPLLTGGPFGNITADIADSLIVNGSVRTNYPGLLLAPANVITATYPRSRDGGFDPATYFVDAATSKYRLKAGSPAINAGGITAGESATDFEGQDRSAAPTDQGADEYYPPAAPPPAGPPPPPPSASGGDGTAPAVVITKPKANQKIKLVTTTTKTVTVTKNGKKVKVKRKTTKRTKIAFGGTAKDPSGIRGVILTIEKLSTSTSAKAAAATTAKCRWFNATKGIVVKSCAKPILLLAKTAKDGAWTFTPKSTIRFGAGTYRVIVAGVDNSGARGNSASRAEAIHRFTLLKK